MTTAETLRFVSSSRHAVFVGNDTVIETCGATLGICNIEKGTQVLQKFRARGQQNVSALCAGPKGEYAYSTPAEKPSIVIHPATGKEYEIAGGAELRHAALAFSRDGSHFAALGSELGREIIIWNLHAENKPVLARKELHATFDKLSFCPHASNIVACAGASGVRLFKLEKGPKSDELQEVECVTLTQVNDMTWTKEGQLLLVTNDNIVQIDPRTGLTTKKLANNKLGVMSLRPIKGYILAGCKSGELLWLYESTLSVDFSTMLQIQGFIEDARRPCEAAAGVFASPVIALDLNESYTKCLVSTERGDRFIVSTKRPQGEDAMNSSQIISSAHTSNIVALTPVLSGPRGAFGIFASVGVDGSLRVWDSSVEARVPVAQTVLHEPTSLGGKAYKLTSLAGSSSQSPFIAIGTRCGHVILAQISKPRSGAWQILVIQTIRAHSGPVSQLTYSPCGHLLASTSETEGVLSIFRVVVPSRAKREAIGLAVVADFPESFVPCGHIWESSERLLVAGCRVDESDSSEIDELLLLQLPTLADINKTSTTRAIAEVCGPLPGLKFGAVGGMIRTPAGHILTTLSHKPQQLEALELTGDKLSQIVPIKAKAHGGHTWALTARGGCIASASIDGNVVVWQDSQDLASLDKDSHTFFVSSTMPNALSFANDTSVLAIGYGDGDLAFAMVPAKLRDPKLVEGEYARPADDDKFQLISQIVPAKEDEGMSESAKWKKRAHDVLESEYEKKRSERRGRIKLLQQRLFRLLEDNAKVPDLEKLPREEFVVDMQGRSAICKSNEAAAEALRSEIEQEIEVREKLYERIKDECWSSMEIPSRELRAIDATDSNKVRNYPVPKQSDAEKRRVTMVMQMRSIELQEIRASGENTSKCTTWPTKTGAMRVLPDEVEWIVNAGLLKPALDDQTEGAGADGAGADGANGDKTKNQGNNEAHSDSGDGDDGEEGSDNEDGDDDENDESKKDEKQDAGETFGQKLIDMLYHPAALRSSFQIRHQLVLLRELQRQLMYAFNERFDKIVEEKEDCVERITSRYDRINEIMRELSRDEEPVPNFWHTSEHADSVLKVSQDEIGVEKYLSKAERERVAREEAERRRREEEAAKDNMGERALEDMMNGTLEAARELTLAEKTMERPDWMQEIEYAEMTEEQRKEHDEFEAQLNKFMEEKEKYIKSLEVEIKKTHEEIDEITTSFSESLKGLLRFKIYIAESIAAQGLYISRLSMCLVRREDIVVRKAKNRGSLQEVTSQRDTMKAEIENFQPSLDAAHAALQLCQEKDRQVEKNFKIRIQELAAASGDSIDADELKILMAMFKYRAGQRAAFLGEMSQHSSRRSSVGMVGRRRSSDLSDRRSRRSSHSSMRGSMNQKAIAEALKQVNGEQNNDGDQEVVENYDPYGIIDESTEEERRHQEDARALVPLDLARDCPESLPMDEARWQLLQNSRLEKIRSELDLKRLTDETALLDAHASLLIGQHAEAVEQIESLRQEYEALQEAENLEAQDLEIIVRLKQGHDEVKPGALISDYSNSLLLDRRVVETENAEIIKLGDAKVGIMKKMKDFRKSINFMEWEHKYMLQQEYDLEEHYTDLHMLRVTRELQELIKGGEVTDTQEQTQQAEVKLTRMKKIHHTKMEKMKTSLDRIEDRKRSLAGENAQLEARIQDLSTNVQMRDAVLQARTGISVLETQESKPAWGKTKAQSPAAGSGASAAKARMKAIVTRRKLMDLARAQTDEIEFLKQELDRLRERNFPRFAHSASTMGAMRNFEPPDAKP